ncbi:MAG: M23 family metallopeptidase [Bdellovibrionales bacterium]|nr:M23 family metallopeptidase [Bdellovibrionales bacterium]
MKNKPQKTFTFLVMANSTDTPKKWVVRASWMWSVVLVVSILTVLGSAVCVDYVRLLVQKNRTHWLRTENAYLKEQLKGVEGKLAALETSLERVESFSKKLRLITNIDAPDREAQLTVEQNPDSAQIQKSDRWPSNIGPIEGVGQGSQFEIKTGEAPMVSTGIKSDYSAISVRIDRVIEGVEFKEKDVLQLWKDLADKNDLIQKTPSIRPVIGWMTSNFGLRSSPFTGDQSAHHGVDIAADTGTPIRAPASGVVSFSGVDEGYGQLIKIDHGHSISTRYGHCSQIYVKVGQTVKRGDIIGAVGSTGRSTGPHLHYEVRLGGVPVNPEKYILE